MFLNKNKILIALAFLLLTFFVAMGFLWGSWFMNPPERKSAAVFRSPVGFLNPHVTSETILTKDKEYLCSDLEKISEEVVPDDLRGLNKKDLTEKFPAAEGWVVNFTDPKFLTLTIKPDEFCPIHRAYRHLGIYHGLLAVYEGPLGFNGKVLRVESIPLESLNTDFRIRLEQAMDFDKQARTTAENLREELEFTSDEALNSALENFDEHS